MNSETITYYLGKKVKEYRVSLKISKLQFAKIVGLSIAQVENIENGRHSPTITGLILFCRVFGCQPNDLLPVAEKIETGSAMEMSKKARVKSTRIFKILKS